MRLIEVTSKPTSQTFKRLFLRFQQDLGELGFSVGKITTAAVKFDKSKGQKWIDDIKYTFDLTPEPAGAKHHYYKVEVQNEPGSDLSFTSVWLYRDDLIKSYRVADGDDHNTGEAGDGFKDVITSMSKRLDEALTQTAQRSTALRAQQIFIDHGCENVEILKIEYPSAVDYDVCADIPENTDYSLFLRVYSTGELSFFQTQKNASDELRDVGKHITDIQKVDELDHLLNTY